MPYIFGGLVVVNALLLAFFIFLHQPNSQTDSVKSAKAQLTQPIEFENSTEKLPPLIGEKK